MRTPERKTTVVVFLALALIAASCRNSTMLPVASGVQALPQTALQWTIIYNGALAKTNRAVEQAVETVQASGAITAAQARPIIVGCGKVAQANLAIAAITSNGTEATWAVDGPKIWALLAASQLKLPSSQNATVDLAVAAVNAALTLLIQTVSGGTGAIATSRLSFSCSNGELLVYDSTTNVFSCVTDGGTNITTLSGTTTKMVTYAGTDSRREVK